MRKMATIFLELKLKSESVIAKNEVETSQQLFREESVGYACAGQYGTVLLARSPSHSLMTVFFVGIAFAIVMFALFFETTRKAQCQGVLVPIDGVIRIVPGQAGLITSMNVSEGQLVKAGDVLFRLLSERRTNESDATQRSISALLSSRRDSFEAELRQSRMQARQRAVLGQRRRTDLELELEHMSKQVALQERRVALAEKGTKRFGELLATKYISDAQFQEKEAELLDQRQRLAELQRLMLVTERELTTIEAETRDLVIQAERDALALRRNASVVQQDLVDNEARREILVCAPHGGVITAITLGVGQTVGANTILASILPARSELQAEIYVTSRSIGFVRPGMRVLLRYQSYPYQKFGQYTAHVQEVANTSFRPDEIVLPGPVFGTGSEPLYRIRLKLEKQSVRAYGSAMPLKSGMLIDASIQLEKRRLYEWVLDPLFSISGRT